MLALVLALIAAGPVQAQTWPARPVTIVVPFAAGGPTDLVARAGGTADATAWASVIVENRVGAGGDIGGQAVAHAAPDGYTFLLSAMGSLTVNRHLKPSANYDPISDFKPV